jgi:hypothetical protein
LEETRSAASDIYGTSRAAANPLLRLPAVRDNAAMEAEPPKVEPPKRKRRWFQFRLRTLMIFTLICAIPCAWLGRKIDKKRREREAVDVIQRLGGYVQYEYQSMPGGPPRQPPGPEWLRSLLGEDFFNEVDFVALQKLSEPESHRRTELNQVYGMKLNGRNVADAAMERLEGLTRLHHLYLTNSEVSDGYLIRLEGLTELQTLDLFGTKITDAGLIHLKRLAQLDTLWLGEEFVTDAGVADLQKALPNCKIERVSARSRPSAF